MIDSMKIADHVRSSEPTVIASPVVLVWCRIKWSVRVLVGRTARLCGLQGVVREQVIDDHFAGHVEIRVSPVGTVVSINGRDLVFSRFTGKLVGSGMAVCGNGRRTAPTPIVAQSPSPAGGA